MLEVGSPRHVSRVDRQIRISRPSAPLSNHFCADRHTHNRPATYQATFLYYFLTQISCFTRYYLDNNNNERNLFLAPPPLFTNRRLASAPASATNNSIMGESRQELLAWANQLLQLNITKVEQYVEEAQTEDTC